MIRVRCNSCGRTIEASDTYGSHSIPCPKCGEPVVMPAAPPPPPEAEPVSRQPRSDARDWSLADWFPIVFRVWLILTFLGFVWGVIAGLIVLAIRFG